MNIHRFILSDFFILKLPVIRKSFAQLWTSFPTILVFLSLVTNITARPPVPVVNCYTPIEGGWQIRLTANTNAPRLAPDSRIGVTQGNARLHRRPLFPPADKTMIWTPDELKKLQRYPFRPLIVAYNEPRFVFDFHSAGGLLGHLGLGLTTVGASKWFHQWSEIDVRYVDGRMEYNLRDTDFPGVVVSLIATPLADSAGLILKVAVEGLRSPATLVWAYGGASAFTTGYSVDAPEFTFAPQQCAKDLISWSDGGFALRRSFDKSDVYMTDIAAAARYIPHWQAVIRGGSSWAGENGFGSPIARTNSPAVLVDATAWLSSSKGMEKSNCVAVQKISLTTSRNEGFIAIGMGGNIVEDLRAPAKAWAAALTRNHTISTRLVTHTPDPYLDAATRMMAFATEGTWGDLAILHGGWSWRYAYLGWRGWYGSTCYGWTDRVKKSIQNHTKLNLVRSGPDLGALGALLEYDPGVYYNMNEVFIDHVRQYFDYTGDLELMREIFPVLVGILDWENRRLQPGNEYLYESSLNTWISDSHWYIQGQCTQASAYMLRANTFLADLARRLGKDATPFQERATHIRAAMQEKLWLPDAGVFAEYRDTLGHSLLHREPELPTIYHSAEFGAADAQQIHQMLQWVDTYLKSEITPNGGKLVWSSNWFPNRGRSYTHSTYEMAYGEELNLALTDYLDGRADESYAILRASLCGIFNGPTPGGLSCHAYADGRQRMNDEFADAISMWDRTVAEGLFGIVPKRPDGFVELTPQFPKDWNDASIEAPQLSYQWQRKRGVITIDWKSPVVTSVHLRLPLQAEKIKSVRVDGKATEYKIMPGFNGLSWVQIQTPTGRQGTIKVYFTSLDKASPRLVNASPSIEPKAAVVAPKKWMPPNVGDHDLQRWTTIDISSAFNAAITNVLKRVTQTAKPPAAPASEVGFGYWKDHLLHLNGNLSDAAWRKKVGPDNIAWTTDSIPFKSAKEGSNIAIVTLAGGFPTKLEFPMNARGKTLYLMISGITFPVQSHVTNLRVTLHYGDGHSEPADLVNPFGIGDCWSSFPCGRFHDTAANGFENLGGRAGPAGSALVKDMTKPIEVDTEAHLIAFDLRPEQEVRAISLEAIANDCIFGLMGATILK